MIKRCLKCFEWRSPIAYRIIENQRRNGRQYLCGDCWDDSLKARGWIKETPSDQIKMLNLRLGSACDAMNDLERILDQSLANMNEEIAIRQMAAFDRISADVYRKYEPELNAVRASIKAIQNHLRSIKEDVEDFAA